MFWIVKSPKSPSEHNYIFELFVPYMMMDKGTVEMLFLSCWTFIKSKQDDNIRENTNFSYKDFIY